MTIKHYRTICDSHEYIGTMHITHTGKCIYSLKDAYGREVAELVWHPDTEQLILDSGDPDNSFSCDVPRELHENNDPAALFCWLASTTQ